MDDALTDSLRTWQRHLDEVSEVRDADQDMLDMAEAEALIADLGDE